MVGVKYNAFRESRLRELKENISGALKDLTGRKNDLLGVLGKVNRFIKPLPRDSGRELTVNVWARLSLLANITELERRQRTIDFVYKNLSSLLKKVEDAESSSEVSPNRHAVLENEYKLNFWKSKEVLDVTPLELDWHNSRLAWVRDFHFSGELPPAGVKGPVRDRALELEKYNAIVGGFRAEVNASSEEVMTSLREAYGREGAGGE